MADKIIDKIRDWLNQNSSDEAQLNVQRFFKESIKTYGIKTPIVSNFAKEQFKSVKNCSKEQVLDYCDQLWQSGFIEESLIACNWSFAIRKQYQIDDFVCFERWISEYVNNWASCDTLCNHTLGEFVMKFPDFICKLQEMTQSPNRWMRRAAAVSLIVPARKGLFLSEIQSIALSLLTDQDDLVQKGYGWMLKAASQAHQQVIFQFVMQHKQSMPRTALRYAIEKMPDDLKQQAMQRT